MARAQQPAMPVIGVVRAGSPQDAARFLEPFSQGLKETGLVPGQNVVFDQHWAQGQYEQLQTLADNLVRRHVAVIAALGSMPAALAAKSATTTIPIVFSSGTDPVASGLVASLNRPGGNVTGVNYFSSDLAPKRLGLIHELLPAATRIAVLVNPNNVNAETATKEVQAAATSIGLNTEIFQARDKEEIDKAFAALVHSRAQALVVVNDSVLTGRRVQLVTLAARHVIPAIYTSREYAEVGGLMTYGANLADAQRQAGIYAGRILKGEKAL